MSRPVFIALASTLTEHGRVLRAGDVGNLRGPEAHHAVNVMRIRPGEEIDICDGAGLRLRTVVMQVRRGDLEFRVQTCHQEDRHRPEIVLVQALAKGGRDELAIETATELGVDGVVAWQAHRCVSVWEGPRVGKMITKWESVVKAAAKQSRRSWVPHVHGFYGSKEAIEWAKESTVANSLVLVLHQDADTSLITRVKTMPEGITRIAIFVGPEGGIDEEEIAGLEAVGAKAVRLGDEVLRTSTAGAAAISVLNTALGRWK